MARETNTQNEMSLTKNQKLVHDTLLRMENPMSAYAILDELRDEGLKAPLQIYRALESLQEVGLVHKLESLNAFIACSRHDCTNHGVSAFMICEKCRNVSEFSDNQANARLRKIAASEDFVLSDMVIELRGLCSNCNAADSKI